MKRVAIGALNLYQRLAPRRVREACLFQPTCSEYAKLAIEEHGVLRGTKLTARRLLRCVPPNGGVDLTGLSLDATQARRFLHPPRAPSSDGCGERSAPQQPYELTN